MLEACPVPCIVTYRPTWEGGQYDGEEEPRLAALWTAVKVGAAYVDCELLAAERFFAAAPEGVRDASATKIILSSHNYESVPSDAELADIHARCRRRRRHRQDRRNGPGYHTRRPPREAPADTADSAADATIVLAWARRSGEPLLAAKFGSFLTFGALRSGAESAPASPRSRSSAICTACPPSPRQPK